MNKLGYQVNWTDTRKYITYTTPEGYKCRDNKLYDKKYSKGAMENEFRRIRRYRTLSKQAMKEYAMKKANSSGFDWFEDEEEMY